MSNPERQTILAAYRHMLRWGVPRLETKIFRPEGLLPVTRAGAHWVGLRRP